MSFLYEPFGIPGEFFIFALTLVAIASLHGQSLVVALTGFALTLAYKLLHLGLAGGSAWLAAHVGHEWAALANLFLLLVGFSVLANQFEQSAIPEAMPRLCRTIGPPVSSCSELVFCMSIFLDNIAAAIIGGVIAKHVYRGQVSIAYLAGIVAAANAGGAGSVLGDTTTTMMWISGVSPFVLLAAFIASCAAFAVFGPLSALKQHRASRRLKDDFGIDAQNRLGSGRGRIDLAWINSGHQPRRQQCLARRA